MSTGCRLPGWLTALGPPSALAGSDKCLATQRAQLSAQGSLLGATLPALIKHRGLLPRPSQWSDCPGPLPASPHPPPGVILSLPSLTSPRGGCVSLAQAPSCPPVSGRSRPPSHHSPSLGQGLPMPPPSPVSSVIGLARTGRAPRPGDIIRAALHLDCHASVWPPVHPPSP